MPAAPIEIGKSSTLKTEKDLFVWTAPARPFKRRDRQFYVTLIAIAFIVGLVLFLVEGFMPVILLISLIFFYYIMSTVPPENLEYKITTRGIRLGDQLTEWINFKRYWFAKRFDSTLLVLETFAIPGRMELVINGGSEGEIKEALEKYLEEEKESPSMVDRAAVWFSGKMPQ